MKRGALLLVVAVGATVGAEWVRESLVHSSDIRAFDGRAVGALDAAMWRSYYERRRLALFGQLVATVRTQFHIPMLRAVRDAYNAAHAAFVFKDGHNRADYERALPDLERYYADLSLNSTRPFDSKRAAQLELEWWIVHREDPQALPASLAALQSEIYGLPAGAFKEHARLRTEAMLLRDEKGQSITEADWVRINELLERSWSSLSAALAKSRS